MAKPIIKPISAFDATEKCVVEFVWAGNMAYNNRLSIYDADTQVMIYQHTYTNRYYALNHDIPPMTLKNDHKYCIQIEVIDVNNETSPPSDKSYFWTATKPKLRISNLEEGSIINASAITVDVAYDNLTNFEELSFLKYYLYDSNKQIIKETEEDKSCALSHIFRALSNNTSYFVRVTGMTVHKMFLDTGYVKVKIAYRNPNSYARIYVENDDKTGFVHYKSNIVVISPERDDYEYESGCIDLSEPNANMIFNIFTKSLIPPGLGIRCLDLEGQIQRYNQEDSGKETKIENYSQITQISLYGKTSPNIAMFPDEHNSLRCVGNCDLIINDYVLPNITEGIELRGLPITNGDSLDIDEQGNRKLNIRAGMHQFSVSDKAVYTESNDGAFICYYALGAQIGGISNDLYCDQLPIASSVLSTVELEPQHGYIKVIWRGGEITTEAQAQEFYNRYKPTIIFPLQKDFSYNLSSVKIPDSTNQSILRYSSNFRITNDATSFILKATKIYQSADIIKVYKGDEITFLLRANLDDEEGTIRFKLTVFGSGGSNYTQYSDELAITPDDVVYICIKRQNGVYSLSVIIDDEPLAGGLWLTSQMPMSGLSNADAWIDLEEGEIYVKKGVPQLTIISDEEPTNADEYTIWIGD